MKQCKVFIEPIAESMDKKEGTKTDKKVVHAEREEERNPEVEMMVKWTKKVNKLVMRCFYQSNPTEITEQGLAEQARVIRTNEWLT